jgi:predicted dehydrogenase
VKRLRGVIIGCGYFGRIHLAAWQRMPEVELVAACDSNAELLADLGIRGYESADLMFEREDLDFVDIATRPRSHLPLVKLTMRRGLPTICQKPMASTWLEAIEMVETAERADVLLMIHENWRWQPWYRAARNMIDRGDIGTPVSYWFRTRHRDGVGTQPYARQSYFRSLERFLIDEALVHYLDTARYLFGAIDQIYAQARRVNPVIAGEDQAVIVTRHTSGLQGTVDGHRYLNPEVDGPALGEAGFEGEGGALHIAATGDILNGSRIVWKNDVLDGYRGDSVRATQQHFIDCLKNSIRPETEARDYLPTFAAVQAAYRSIAEKRAVELREICGQSYSEAEQALRSPKRA